MAGSRKETFIIVAILLAVALAAVLAFRSFATGGDGAVSNTPSTSDPAHLGRHANKRRNMTIGRDGGR